MRNFPRHIAAVLMLALVAVACDWGTDESTEIELKRLSNHGIGWGIGLNDELVWFHMSKNEDDQYCVESVALRVSSPVASLLTKAAAGALEVASLGVLTMVGCDGGGEGWGPAGCTYGTPVIPSGTYSVISPGHCAACALSTSGAIECFTLEPEYLCFCTEPSPVVKEMPVGSFIDIVVAGGACALTTEGEIQCWGCDGSEYADESKCESPAGTFTSLGAGESVFCAIKEDNTVSCWGCGENENQTICDVPDTLFTQVTNGVGTELACGVRTDGAIECWDGTANTLVIDEGPFTEAAVGSSGTDPVMTCGLRQDQTVVCWDAEYNSATGEWTIQLNEIAGTYLDISAGDTAVCGLTTDNAVECWGPGL